MNPQVSAPDLQHRFFAPCAKGLEYLLVDELRALGAAQVHEALAGVHFTGSLETGYRACLWSRLASRVLLLLAEFDAGDDAALYAGVAAIDWARHLRIDGTLAVDANSQNSRLTHTRFLEQRTKDAVVDQFRREHGARPSVDTERPQLRLNLSLRRDRAMLSIDLAGIGLHRRDWRIVQLTAPMKPPLACAVLLRGEWPRLYAEGGALLDPMCGSGTLLIEGAWMAGDIAPGLQRDYFGFLGWLGHDAPLWQRLLADAQQRAAAGRARLRPCFFGSDSDPAAIAATMRNAQAAGVAGTLQLTPCAVADIEPPLLRGLLVCNPPYDERLATDETPYRELGAALRARFAGWQAAVLTSDESLGHALGLRAHKRYVLYNGTLRCLLLCIDPAAQPQARPAQVRALSPGAQMAANRLRRNLRATRAWRRREEVECFRAYDADLPEYAAAIDVYREADGAQRRFLHVQEYQAPRQIPADTARRRLEDLVHAAMTVFELPREQVSLKTRAPQTRTRRYQRQDARGEFLTVPEGGLRFLVNLTDYLDTGLFLDHRPVRALLRELAAGKRFLNLFCYTATASVYAAAGGALSTTSVDLSATYLEWAARNLALNGFKGNAHRLVQADVMAWLRGERERFDLIFCDPPTFSNSARAGDFDVQRQHPELIRACMARLAPQGVLLFSNNYRRFRMDPQLGEEFALRELGATSIPPDFARDARMHRVWEVRRP